MCVEKHQTFNFSTLQSSIPPPPQHLPVGFNALLTLGGGANVLSLS